MKKDSNKYPKGITAAKVRRIIEYYGHQTDEEAAAEIESAPEVRGSTWIFVPVELVPQVRQIIQRRRKSA